VAYTLTLVTVDQGVTSVDNCTASLLVKALPTPVADDKSVCAGSSVALTGTPAGGTWSGAHVSGSTFDATGLAAGPYTVTYTVTVNGCTASDDAVVTVKALPTPVADDKSVCAGSSVALTEIGRASSRKRV